MAACKPDFETLSACPAAEPCPRSFVQLIEGYLFTVSLSPECTLQALRDRVPGRYRHDTDSTWSGGSTGSQHVVLVYANGQAGYARDPYGGGFQPTPVEPIAGQRCQLKPARFFEECLAALAANPHSSLSFRCLYAGEITSTGPLPWFESCVSESPSRCE